MEQKNQNSFYRFQVFQKSTDKQKRSIGMAYFKQGQKIFNLRLWMFMNERYYLVPKKEDASKFLIMTREPNKKVGAKNKFHWNIVGNGRTDSATGTIELYFDLFERPVFMNIFPEASSHIPSLSDPDELFEVA